MKMRSIVNRNRIWKNFTNERGRMVTAEVSPATQGNVPDTVLLRVVDPTSSQSMGLTLREATVLHSLLGKYLGRTR